MPVSFMDLLDELRGELENINQVIFRLELLQVLQAHSGSQLPWTAEILAVSAVPPNPKNETPE